ncbi:response regulator transcription factor [Spirosoma aureum]|uniref:Response regulator transcription factor n=1 Tax=Spirosoma aureum TaxID=2692134 RepID=A0A6G9AGE5_9BACT|nr:response regulator transcription factor [Spirosoma aureum]QIP11508.1 response regulator transcription factor [Spirosoma aureum]
MNQKYHLLIVDENPYVADILIQTLKTDFSITVANTGHEAARLLIQGHRFDCVLTELNLPVFSGLELTKLIRMSKLIFQTPVIVLSNAPDSNTRIECLEQGVDSYIAKPFNPLEVKAKIHAILRRTSAPKEEVQEPTAAVRLQAESKPVWQPKSRILSMLLRGYLVAQSA